MTQAEQTEATEPEHAGTYADGFSDPEVANDPQTYYRKMRAVDAVIPGTWGPQVVRRSTIEYVLQHPDEFSSGMAAVDLGQSVPLIPLQVDPPNHRNYRRLLDPIFAPKRMNALEPDIAKLVNELIDRFIDRGDASSAQSSPCLFRPRCSCDWSGCPLSELDMFLEMKDGILRPAGDDLDELQAAQQAAAKRGRALLRRGAGRTPKKSSGRLAVHVRRRRDRRAAADRRRDPRASASSSSWPGWTRSPTASSASSPTSPSTPTSVDASSTIRPSSPPPSRSSCAGRRR